MTTLRRSPGQTSYELATETALELVGPSGRELVAAAVAAADGSLRRCRPTQATLRPGRSITVSYDTTVVWGGDRPQRQTFVAHAAARLPDPTARVRCDDGLEVALWRNPDDPDLPALAAALDRSRIAGLVRDLGAGSPRPNQIRLRTRAYRPRRRAVVEVTFPGGQLFVKVVPPGHAAELHRRHRRLAVAVPVPDSLGYTDDGLVVLPAMAGHTLRHALAADGHSLVAGAALLDLLDRLPADLTTEGAARGPLTQLHHHIELLTAVLPSESRRLATLAGELETEPQPGEALVPVHGDLYEAQLLVGDGRITGLLDVDTAGAGHRLDDLANAVGHLSLLARARPECRRRAERLGAQWMATFDRVVDPVRLRRRAAAVVLGLATGPFRVQERAWPAATRARLALAEEWLASAGSPGAPTRSLDLTDHERNQ